MILLYLIFVVLPFIAFSCFIYKSVCTFIHEKNKRNEFFNCLRYENKQFHAYENFSKKYEIEKYKYYLKVERKIEVNYNTDILEELNSDSNEVDRQNEQYLESLLDDIYNDQKYAKDSELCDPRFNWMRKLSNEDIVKLKVLLLKKAIYFLPICNKIFQDKNKKHRLYNNYYIDDNMSKELDGQCEEFLEEFNLIIYEANCLSPRWGETIISDAYRIFHHNKIKADEEKKKKEELKNLAKKQKQKETKLKETTEKANLLANEIIEEENLKKKKKKKSK
ncbi:conserved Plasmodium protein, unknown function [Plasmodium vivax]|uniref:(malaria parasite P. vivax) hypothetical protein n=1 Tax=Plasmodium vivax TaxID=5855 RepID=A0A1G4H8C9_PLAVI|nr:unnamed protein product [Plasmodium vivax]CAI7718574.1 translocation protein SEC66, putative [Plasmodium vivax]SCO65715.1 conserved Plasmodium protein, unknown function [Plasmodium vivax]SCO71151.1 conserved Plasmodium protein, unknown function [Plasmodium vivax]